jgi:hypothetical protein
MLPKTRVRGTAFAVTAGFLLLQIGWLFAVPPVRGIDEFDHIYRAAAVVDGQWFAEPTQATRGTGTYLVVPGDIVEATRDECSALPYTAEVECDGVPLAGARVVAGGAGRYHPAYYAVVGLPTLAFDGIVAIYAMRVLSLILCASMLWLGLTALRHLEQRRWLPIGICVGITPVVAYSSIVIAPNGLEIMAALLLWLSFGALLRSPDLSGALLARVALSGGLLVTLRSLGPLWCFMILVISMLSVPGSAQRTIALLRSRIGSVTAVTVAGCTVASLAWIFASRALEIGHATPTEDSPLFRVKTIAGKCVLWLLQSIAAFPRRGDAAHPVVYVCIGIVGLVVFVAAARASEGRARASLAAVALLSVLVPAAISWATFTQFVATWQGRYTLPFSIGFAVLAGLALSLRPQRWLAHPRLGALLGLLYAIGHTVGPAGVQLRELGSSPSVGNGNWVMLPPVVVGSLCCTGAGLMWLAAWRSTRLPLVKDRAREALEDGGMTPPPEVTPGGRGGVHG